MNTRTTQASRTGLASRTAGFILYAAGILFGLLVFIMSSWADLEAFLYDTSLSADTRLGTLRCPYMVTPAGENKISASFANKTDVNMRRTVRSRITDGTVTLWREDRQRFTLEPGDSIDLEWPVYYDDSVYGRFVFARVYLFRAYPHKSSTGTCGILTVPVSFLSGTQATAATLALYSALTGGGLYLWSRRRDQLVGKTRDARNAMVWAGVLVFAGIVVGIAGWWLLQEFILLPTVMLIVIALLYFLRDPD